MSYSLEVIPAYGRDYKSAKAARADWEANLDFIEAASRQYINREDAERLGARVLIRYDRLTKVMVI